MRRRLRRRPAPPRALTPKSTKRKAPGSDDSGALRVVPFGKAVIVLVPTGNPPSLRFGHPDVTSDDTAFPRWGTVRVRPRFPGSRSRPRCRSVPVHLPKATSGYPLGCSPQRSKEERSTREGGFPCRSVGRCAPAASLGRGRGTRTDAVPHSNALSQTE